MWRIGRKVHKASSFCTLQCCSHHGGTRILMSLQVHHFQTGTFLFFGGIFNCHELPYLYQDPNVITQSLLTQISQQLSNTNHSISVTGPLPKVLSLLPLWQYLSTPSGSSASCSVSVAHLWLHFCNIGRAGTSRLFNDITHRMSTPTSESTFFEAHTSSAPSGFPSSCRLFFSFFFF